MLQLYYIYTRIMFEIQWKKKTEYVYISRAPRASVCPAQHWQIIIEQFSHFSEISSMCSMRVPVRVFLNDVRALLNEKALAYAINFLPHSSSLI